MQSFSAILTPRPGLYVSQLVALPPSIQLTPERWSAADIGGPKSATIAANGTPEDLALLLTWLGNRAIIYNEFSTPVWWGVVYEIEAVLGGVTVNLSLDSVFNRIAVLYSAMQPDGSTESERTEWVQDDNSINRYGQRELLYSLQEGTSDTAASVRDRLLETLATPAPVIATTSGSRAGATLHCRGQWELLDFVYWSNLTGLVEHTDGNTDQILGALYVADTIHFGITVDPSGGDNDVGDTADGLGALVADVDFHIEGAANPENRGNFTSQALVDPGHVEVGVSTIVDETAGATVYLSLGHGAAALQLAQSFVLPTPISWIAHKVSVRVRRVGNPSDNLVIKIKPDNAGEPDASQVAVATLVGSTIPEEMGWVEASLAVPVTLSAATTYWLHVQRDGAYSLDDHYVIDLDEELGHSGSMLVFGIGATWDPRDPDADMPFRIVGQVDSVTQMEDAIDTSPEFLGVITKTSSGIMVDTYQEIERTILATVEELMELGTSDGSRLTARVDFGRNIIIETAPDSTDANPMIDMGGRLRHASGALWEPGALVAGRWIDIEAMPVLDGLTRTRGRRGIYVKEAEYDAAGERLVIQSEGAPDPWTALHIRRG